VVKRPRSFRNEKDIREKGKLPTDNDNYMNKNNATEHFDKQSLTGHLRDLRSCLIVSLIAVAAGFGVAYAYIDPIGVLLFKPLTDVLPKGTSLIFTSYQEGFFFI
jgi:sec-independent protein translocase protein TatC